MPSIGAGLERARNFERIATPEERDKQSFLAIASFFQSQQCQNPADKVFGMMSLSYSYLQARPRPDSTRCLEGLYTSVVTLSLVETGSLDFLSYVYGHSALRDSNSRRMELPTFVPDLTATVPDQIWNTMTLFRCESICFYNSMQGSFADSTIFQNREAITSAMVIDTLVATLDFDDLVASFRQFKHLKSRPNPYKNVDEAFWRTLCEDTHKQLNSMWKPAEASDVLRYNSWYIWAHTTTTPLYHAGKSVQDFQVLFNIQRAGRRFAVTEMGYIGWVPWKAHKGDAVALMPGGKVPYVLRQVSEAEDGGVEGGKSSGLRKWRFLGDAYVHGVMHGEAWDPYGLEQIVLV